MYPHGGGFSNICFGRLQQVSILEQGPLTLCVPMLMQQLQELRLIASPYLISIRPRSRYRINKLMPYCAVLSTYDTALLKII